MSQLPAGVCFLKAISVVAAMSCDGCHHGAAIVGAVTAATERLMKWSLIAIAFSHHKNVGAYYPLKLQFSVLN